uniref:Uncharacterized protein n=1 Tax=Micrurus spixii TaxID=129469 RepID=A0A2D4LQ74_9SAUR
MYYHLGITFLICLFYYNQENLLKAAEVIVFHHYFSSYGSILITEKKKRKEVPFRPHTRKEERERGGVDNCDNQDATEGKIQHLKSTWKKQTCSVWHGMDELRNY